MKIVYAILGVIVGFFVGSLVNMGIIMLGSMLISLPPGIDPTNMESLKESMHLMEAKHFIFPFLAHAIGTLVGASIAVVFTKGNKLVSALIVAAIFLAGGIINALMLPAPLWFIVLDLVVAYIPMGLLASKMIKR